MQILNCTLKGNSGYSGGGGIHNDGPGGAASLQIINSTLSDNSALGGTGAGILNNGERAGNATVQILNSTLSGNSAGGGADAIRNFGCGGIASVQIVNSTLNSNSRGFGLGRIFNNCGTLEIGSTVLNAATGGNIENIAGTVTSLGYNLSSDDGGGLLTATGDQINSDPLLGPLQDNGGPTFTHALLCGSPAIDKGKNFSPSASDQRGIGFARTFDDLAVSNAADGDGTDVGAFEAQVDIVDTTPPSIMCPPDKLVPATSDAGVALDYPAPSAADDCSAVTVECSPPTGSTFPIGSTTVLCTATDRSGNHSNCAFMVHVKGPAEQLNDLISLVQSFNYQAGLANSLIVRLQAPGSAVGRANPQAACGILNAFLNEVNAHMGKKQITGAQASLLSAEVTRIRAVLNCP